jgi:two-component sensor histidine kinase
VAEIEEVIKANSALTEMEYLHLLDLLSEWQMLADISFADLVLWVPIRSNYLDWPEGYIAFSHIRPTTAATLFPHDLIGERLTWGENGKIDHSLKTGEILRDVEPEYLGDLLVKEETVPVHFQGRTIAVISRHRNAEQMRSASRLEINYREIAHKIYQMIAEGEFPIAESIYHSESAPRVGDGLIRLDAQGSILYCSPNGRSAMNRAGWSGELVGTKMGDLVNKIKGDYKDPVDESWQDFFTSRTANRGEFENDRGVYDFLSIPLIEHGERIGAVVLVHNITELRRRDRALISKDATIKEIHHRVKNNLQTVSALLRLQSRRVEDPAASAALAEAVRRVASIAIVHETLAASSAQVVEFDEVYARIIAGARELTTRNLEIVKKGEFGSFESRIATPLALVVTELIHNALEHGLETIGDHLTIEIERNPNRCQVKVIDNGAGLPSDFNLLNSSNLGLQIVQTLTENELKGSITLESEGKETTAKLEFPL